MKRKRGGYALLILLPLVFGLMRMLGAGREQPAQSEATPSGEKGGTCCKAGDTTPPTELVKQVPKGQLHSPYPDYAKLAKDDPDLVKQFRLPGCNAVAIRVTLPGKPRSGISGTRTTASTPGPSPKAAGRSGATFWPTWCCSS